MDNDERLLGRPNKPRRDWLGVRDKTAWDWLSLLIVPLFIVIATVVATAVLNYFETERENERAEALRQADRERADALLEAENKRAEALRQADIERARTQQEIEDDRVRQTVLQSYIQDMTELLLDKGLATSEPDQPIRDIARSSTLTAVRQLDSDRKGILLQFLSESNLISNGDDSGNPTPSIIFLLGADLSGANLSLADLSGANLSDADLSGADLYFTDLQGADLSGADLSYANLRGAHLTFADLSDAFLSGAHLNLADLSRANLRGAHLSGAVLRGAKLNGADLSDAFLSGADLTGAKEWTNEQLAQASSLVGATLPDGTVIETEEAWEEFKKRYGQ
jgi:uncharacterized protein YjbI with pentapeptide repeats